MDNSFAITREDDSGSIDYTITDMGGNDICTFHEAVNINAKHNAKLVCDVLNKEYFTDKGRISEIPF